MKSYRALLFSSLLFITISMSFVACDKSDPYIDWKVINKNWYEAHKNDDGFTLTETGLCYRRISMPANNSERQPNMTDVVWVDYSKFYIDGNQFDSGKNVPLSLSSVVVVAGFREGLLQMRHGEEFEFYIPADLGYGSEKSGLIPPYSTLIFKVRLNYSMAN